MNLTIRGFDNWEEAVPERVEYLDGTVVSFDQYVADHVEMNRNLTTDNIVISWFVKHGFKLEQAVIETSNEPEWGKMTWIKNHPVYEEPPKSDLEKRVKEAGDMPLWRAMFRLEDGTEVDHCMFSCGGGGFLHKSFTYHEVVFSPPSESEPK